MNQSLLVKITCTICLLMAGPGAIHAQVHKSEVTTVQEVFEASEIIVRAVITEIESKWYPYRRLREDGEIHVADEMLTEHYLDIVEYHKNPENRMVCSFYGPNATVDGVTVMTTHTPIFEVGMEVLISLRFDPVNEFYVLQGFFPYGQIPIVYIVKQVDGREALIPYKQYHRALHSLDDTDFMANAVEQINPDDDIFDLSNKSMLWLDDLKDTHRNAQDHEE